MVQNGIKNKDQLQCRTHGQKYLLSLEEIERSISKFLSDKTKAQGNHGASNPEYQQLDKKMYPKLQRYEDDKRFLYKIYLSDQSTRPNQSKSHKLNLDFQDETP